MAGCLLLAAGCLPKPAEVSPPAFDPDGAARLALAEYDTNKDGFLDAKELQRCPALLQALKDIDTSGDKKLSAEEIAARLRAFQASNIGLVGVPCRVQLDNAPLEGATVTLQPESFMGSTFAPASGVTDARGQVILRTEGQDLPGVRWGYFRITVSKQDAAGNELLPARYNRATTLRQEVAPDRRGSILLRLSAKP